MAVYVTMQSAQLQSCFDCKTIFVDSFAEFVSAAGMACGVAMVQ
jgi:hypothetical protein